MPRNFLRVSTSNGEDRWINLDRVTRVSVSQDKGTGETALVFCFDGTDRVTIHGGDTQNKDAIRRVLAMLNELAAPTHLAA